MNNISLFFLQKKTLSFIRAFKNRDKIGLTISFIICLFAYAWVDFRSGIRPHSASHDSGWWTWFDQWKYLQASLAWASGNFNPDQHWYLPGYPILGAPFVNLTVAQPFLIPDLVCLLISLYLCSRLAVRLLPPNISMPETIGAFSFLLGSVLTRRGVEMWIVPWSTTATTPLIMGCLIFMLRLYESPSRRDAMLMGLALGAIPAFRPTDAISPGIVLIPLSLAILVRLRADLPLATRLCWAFVLGLTLPLLALAIAHFAIQGLNAGQYLTTSAAFGFEPRLLPLRYVSIFLNPAPIWLPSDSNEGVGIAVAFPWVLPGMVGIAVSLTTTTGCRRIFHLIVSTTTLLHGIIYLCYRDLHPSGIWLYNNYHYFKFLLPILSFYAFYMLIAVILHFWRTRIWITICFSVAIVLPWRIEEKPLLDQKITVLNKNSIAILNGLPNVGDTLRVQALGSWDAIYFGLSTMRVSGLIFKHFVDFKIFPISGGFILTTLRPLPTGQTVLDLDPRVALVYPQIAALSHLTVRYGFPLWIIAGKRE